MLFYIHIRGPEKMHPLDFGDSLTYLAPCAVQIFVYPLKYLNSYLLDLQKKKCPDSHGSHWMFLIEFDALLSSATIGLTVSGKLFSGLSENLVFKIHVPCRINWPSPSFKCSIVIHSKPLICPLYYKIPAK